MEYVIAAGLGFVLLFQSVIFNQLAQINGKVDEHMATLQDITDKLDRIDASVDAGTASHTGIKSDLDDLKAQLAAGGLNAADEATLEARIATTEAKVAEHAASLAGTDAEHPAAAPEPPVE